MDRDVDSRTPPDRGNLPIPPRPHEPPPEPPRPISREPETVAMRGYRYQISLANIETLREIGRFRTVRVDDLARHFYPGRTHEMQEDLQSLRNQGLVQRRTACTGGKGEKIDVLVLTKPGKAIAESRGPFGSSQQVYSGFVKPAEARHDAAIYPMYQAEAARIACEGGRVTRVVLDYEFKRRVYSPLAKAKALPPLEYARRQADIASQNSLKVVRGKILLPDLRIEYETPSGTSAHVDLELATHHYRGAHLRGKAEAGFKMYAPQDSIAGLTAAFDPEFMAEIFSL